jgi:hypothetical protein
MILGGQYPLGGPLEGVGLGNRDFIGPEMATREPSAIWSQVEISWAHQLPMARVIGLPTSKSV